MPKLDRVYGHFAQPFAPVAHCVARLLEETDGAGLGVCAYHRGEQVVNLWGGTRDRDHEQPWQEDTLVNVFSATKAFTSTAALLLADRGELELQAPIADYWPAFAANGKSDIRIKQVLNHTAGLAAFSETIPDDDLYDWASMVAHVEAMVPNWPPGSRQGYHVFTFGWILGELIHRVSGQLPGDFIAKNLCEPLGLDFHIGLENEDLSRCADVAPMPAPDETSRHTSEDSRPKQRLSTEDLQLMQRAFANPSSLTRGSNSGNWRRAQVPAANGHGTAAALAGLYNRLYTDHPQLPALLSDKLRRLCWQETTAGADCILGTHMAYSQGFFLPTDNAEDRFGRGPRSFGHPGAGGSIGFADPDAELSFAFVTRNLGSGLLLDNRASRLMDTVYACL